MYGQGLADERQGHSCIASPLSPSSFDTRPRPRMERGTPGTSPLDRDRNRGGGEMSCMPPHGTRPIRGSYSDEPGVLGVYLFGGIETEIERESIATQCSPNETAVATVLELLVYILCRRANQSSMS